MTRLSDLLNRAAIALKGPEPELTKWSFHDVPELTARLKQERDRLQAYVQHKVECAKVTRETVDGHIVKLTPWEADKKACT